jgi:GTP-binding protein
MRRKKFFNQVSSQNPENILILQKKKMRITEANFLTSSVNPKDCPPPNKPEYAFIGRSNVGKSSLLNMLCNRKNLAKTSGTPGKTRLINHFLINQNWYMVDLPGYGYAKISKTEREKFIQIIARYLSRHAPMKADLDFIQTLGRDNIPFSIVFTKTDKLKPAKLEQNITEYQYKLLDDWSELPPMFLTSATNQQGREELLEYINSINNEQ